VATISDSFTGTDATTLAAPWTAFATAASGPKIYGNACGATGTGNTIFFHGTNLDTSDHYVEFTFAGPGDETTSRSFGVAVRVNPVDNATYYYCELNQATDQYAIRRLSGGSLVNMTGLTAMTAGVWVPGAVCRFEVRGAAGTNPVLKLSVNGTLIREHTDTDATLRLDGATRTRVGCRGAAIGLSGTAAVASDSVARWDDFTAGDIVTSQQHRPASDVTTAGWSSSSGVGSLASHIDDDPVNDTDYVTSVAV